MRPPIPVSFHMDEPGHVTLVIDGLDGKRVRNLVAETSFEAGDHTVWWDGLDEGESIRLPRGAGHAIGNRRFVETGTYRVRGLVRKQIDLVYEFSVYTGGRPPWFVGRSSAASGGEPGGWLADHSAPSDVVYLPGGRPPHYRAARLSVTDDRYVPAEDLLIPSEPPLVMIGSPVSETGHGFAWCDLDGRKVAGIRSYGHGGRWFPGATCLARDEGAERAIDTYVYYGVPWLDKIYIQALPSDKTVVELSFPELKPEAGQTQKIHAVLSGLAARDGMIVVSLGQVGKLVLIDASRQAVLREVAVDAPLGVAFDAKGRLLAVSGTRVLRWRIDPQDATLREEECVVDQGLSEPQQIALDRDGNIYVSDWGDSHQVNVFAWDGRFVRTIGKAGVPAAGRYDELRMNHPNGLTVTPTGELWVAEKDHGPKRISVWQTTGTFVRAMYGPSKYGGGGDIDEHDPTRFYYAERDVGLEYKLDWGKGTGRLVDVYYRRGQDDLVPPPRYLAPQKAIRHRGRTYMTNAYSAWATYGGNAIGIWLRDGDVIRPVAMAGSLDGWPWLIEKGVVPPLPEDVRRTLGRQKRDDRREQVLQQFYRDTVFAWADLNGDSRVQHDETTFRRQRGNVAQVTVDSELGLHVSTTTQVMHLIPQRYTDDGAPVYDPNVAEITVDGVPDFHMGGVNAQCVSGDDGWLVKLGAPVRGFRNGKLAWTYHNQWPSLHAGHHAPRELQYPGQLIATTRLLGWTVRPNGTDVELWALNSDRAVVYLMTTDGLFVGQLGKLPSQGPPWNMAECRRGMLLNDVNFVGEHFWPTIAQAPDGTVYMVLGKSHSSIVRVDGLDTIRRIPATEVEVTPDMLSAAAEFATRAEAERQAGATETLRIPHAAAAPLVDGNTSEWPEDTAWVEIDPKTKAALCVSGGHLYAGWRTEEGELLVNTAESGLDLLFKTGGALDLMIGTAPDAPSDRRGPVAGDVRLLITHVGKKAVAALFKAHVPRTDNPLMFSSPSRTVRLDRVDDVSSDIELASGTRVEVFRTWRITRRDTYYDYELSVPLSILGLDPTPGTVICGDIGILRGTSGQTYERVYWHNKASGIISDIPSEAALTPNLWGKWEFAVGR